jgi:protoporphyrin/coproporphyrin ferrochelatase
LQKLPGQGTKIYKCNLLWLCRRLPGNLRKNGDGKKAVFMGAGGTDYRYIPALNDSDFHVNAIVNLLDEWI